MGPRTVLGSAAVAPLVATAGCGTAPTLSSGTHSISSGGQSRSNILRVPANYDNNHPYRLMFGFYWVGGTANDVDSGGTDGYNWSYYGLRRLSDNAGGQGTADGTAVILWSCNGGSNQQWSLRS